jgi:hypothetical protein
MKVIAESLLKFIENVETDFQQEDKAFGVDTPIKTPVETPPAPDTRAENKDLFEATARSLKNTVAESVTDAVEAVESEPEPVGEPEAAPDTGPDRADKAGRKPGVPPDMQPETPAGGDYSTTADTRHLADGPPELDRTTGADRKGLDQAPAAEDQDSALSDISDIIERMADGQRELLGETKSPAPQPAPGPSTRQPASRPATNPPAGGSAGPSSGVESRKRPWDAPAGQDSGDMLETAPPHRPITVVGESEPETEVATALERPPAELPENETARTVPTGSSITSEMSLEEIKRSLEKRIAEEKEKNRRDG